MFRYYNNQTDR